MGHKQFKGNDRFLMFLCRDIRRRWMQYGENRLYNLKAKGKKTRCFQCQKRQALEWDHITPVGQRPYTLEALPAYIHRMLDIQCQPLCRRCNALKGDKTYG